MASMEPIDITSSDSDSELREIDNYKGDSPEREINSSNNVTRHPPKRHLPFWAGNSSNPGSGTSRRDPSSSSLRIVRDEIGSLPNKRFGNGNGAGSSSSQMAQDSGGRFDPSRDVHSFQNMKRSLPVYLQNHSSNVGESSSGSKRPFPGSHPYPRIPNAVDIGGKARDASGKPFPAPGWSITSNGNNPLKENAMWSNPNDPSLFENRGRLLPPSLMMGRSSPAMPFAPSNDNSHAGYGEEAPAAADERFVFQAAVQDLHQPKVEADLPPNILTVSLLRHQKIALAWMLSKESSGLCLGGILADDQGLGKTISTISLIQMQMLNEAKSKSNEPSSSRPVSLNLDDDDGNGVVDLDEANGSKESEDFTILPQASNSVNGFRSKRPRAGTLIVCPASVVRQWARELEEKVTKEARLSVLVYHGGNRTKDPVILAGYDAVLTTYAIVANEVPKQPLVDDDEELKDREVIGLSSSLSVEKKKKKPTKKNSKKGKNEIDMSAYDSSCGTLAKVIWSRVVLDESQTIKNHRTQVARACCSLRAKRRWCLSGTPIQNSVEELFSYFRFLRYDPYDKYKMFTSSIKHLISRDSAKGYKKLQVVLRNIMLRRTKGTVLDGKPIINLPPKRVDLAKVNFSIEERAFYNQLESDSRKQFKAYAAAGTVNQNYANILLLLLRLRQACDHPLLVKGMSSDPVGRVSNDMAKALPRDLLVNLFRQLETSLAICLVCRDPPENAVVTMCGHVFCYQCVSDYLTGEDNTCPATGCKEQLGADVVFSRSTLRRCLSDDIDGDSSVVPHEPIDKSMVLKRDYVSSKIQAALAILVANCVSKGRKKEFYDLDGDALSPDEMMCDSGVRDCEKAIVFSQWTTMLDLLEISLKNSGLNYRRLDGTMSIPARDKAVKDFNTDPKVDVMIMSLKAGNLGLNMVAASRVILLDLWWNPTTEDQAVDRAHRIGQTRPVTVSRLTITDTVEDRILSLQEDKRKMVASAFGEDQSGGHGSRLTVEDLRFLFEGR